MGISLKKKIEGEIFVGVGYFSCCILCHRHSLPELAHSKAQASVLAVKKVLLNLKSSQHPSQQLDPREDQSHPGKKVFWVWSVASGLHNLCGDARS